MTGKKKPTAAKRPRTKIFVVDDHPMMRQGLAQLIHNEPDLELCGEAENAAIALQLIYDLHQNLAIAHISLRAATVHQLIKDRQFRYPELAILDLSMDQQSPY